MLAVLAWHRTPTTVPAVTTARTPALRTAHSTPQRFLIYSFRHSGTHFLRNALMRAPGVSIGDEVFMCPPPKFVKVGSRDAELPPIKVQK